MITEVAEILVHVGAGDEFERAVAQATPLFRAARGCHHVRLERSIEQPERYWLMIQWETVADHVDHFRSSANFAKWRAMVGPYFAQPPHVEHAEVVLSAF